MKPENQQPQAIRSLCDAARVRVSAFTGLYGDEDLTNEVLSICDDVLVRVGSSPRLDELRTSVAARCRHLADVTNRFSRRDTDDIAKARLQMMVALDQLQDAALERLKAAAPQQQHAVLRRRDP